MSHPGYVTVEVDLPEGWLLELGTMHGCGDSMCAIRQPTGMQTNGGCRCSTRIEEAFGCTRRQASIFISIVRFMKHKAEQETQP